MKGFSFLQAMGSTFPTAVAPSLASWRAWFGTVLMGIGMTLFLAGVIFFFAYNWNQLGVFARFGLVEGLFLAAALAAVFSSRKNGTALRLSGMALAIMTGIFWAVYGQYYQTGADAWQLFALWLACALPFLFLTPSLPLWILCILLANTALILWRIQAGMTYWEYREALENGLLFLNTGLLVAAAAMARWKSRRHSWYIAALVPFLVMATLKLSQLLINMGFERRWAFMGRYGHMDMYLAGLCLLLLAGIIYLAWKKRTATPLYLSALSGLCLLNCGLFALVARSLRFDSPLPIILLFLLANLGYVALMAYTLPRHSKVSAHSAEASQASPRLPLPPGLGHQIVMGIAALVSTLCLIALCIYFMALMDMFLPVVPGILLVVMATCFYRGYEGHAPFIGPFSLCLALAGVGFLLAWSWMLPGLHSLAFCAAALLIYIAIPQPILRFLVPLAALSMIAHDILFRMSPIMYAYSLSALLIFCALAPALLLWRKTLPKSLLPAAWAAILFFAWFPLGHAQSMVFNAYHAQEYTSVLPLTLQGISFFLSALLLATTLKSVVKPPNLIGFFVLGALAWLLPPQILLALFFLALGHAHTNSRFKVLGILLLLASLSLYYYNLDVSLLSKAMRLMVTGLGLAMSAALAVIWDMRLGQLRFTRRFKRVTLAHLPPQGIILCLLVALYLGVFQGAIVQKQLLLLGGREILLALRPVDPRSLMQGDYMELDYAISRLGYVIGDEEQHRTYRVAFPLTDLPNGRQTVDEAGVRLLQDGEDWLEDWQILLFHQADRFSILPRLPRSFFFQEGHGQWYDEAQYAVLRCSPKGQCLLFALADQEGENITP